MGKFDDALIGAEGLNFQTKEPDLVEGYELCTSKQRQYIYILCNQLDIDQDSFSCQIKEMTKRQASELIEELVYAKENKDFGINYDRSGYDDNELPFY